MRACDDTDDGDSDDTDEDAADSDGSDGGYDEVVGTVSGQDQTGTRMCLSVYTDNYETTRRRCVSRKHKTTTAANVESPENPLQDSVAEFCAYICTEPYRDGKAGTTIMVYLAGVLGIA